MYAVLVVFNEVTQLYMLSRDCYTDRLISLRRALNEREINNGKIRCSIKISLGPTHPSFNTNEREWLCTGLFKKSR